jgi:MFS family permease
MSENNRMRLLWAGFMAILAAGVGFAIRGGIFDNWAKEFGFTGAQLGAIGGMGFNGFCFGIILGGVVVDKIGYGKLVVLAFLLHVASALITFTASGGNAFMVLSLGMFIFAFANGALEAVANPLVATLFPENRTHYLNILHASWPAGMVIGVIIGWFLDDKMEINWRIQLALYLIPTVIYGLMFMGQKFPQSEPPPRASALATCSRTWASSAVPWPASSFLLRGRLLQDVVGLAPEIAKNLGYGVGGALLIGVGLITKFSLGSIVLFVLFVTHALVGAVELGTDGWIQNITGNLFTPEQGKALFLWTSAIMFGLRFCAHWIEKTLKLSPVGLLFVCSVLAAGGLTLASTMNTFTTALIALGIYAFGKTFFWPTMLAVASDRFPRTGAVAISIMGGIGMLSAGIIGGPGLGYMKDRFAGEELKAKNPALYETYKAAAPSKFLNLDATATIGLDGKKLSEAKEAKEPRHRPAKVVVLADQQGDRKTLKFDAYIPATMAAIYLLLLALLQGHRRLQADHHRRRSGGREGCRHSSPTRRPLTGTPFLFPALRPIRHSSF